MEQNENSIRPEAATDEPASSLNPRPAEAGTAPADPLAACSFATPAEDEAYWKGVVHGTRCVQAEPVYRHRPRDWDADLSRPGTAPALTPDGLAEAYAPVTTDAIGRNIRDDGFTPARQRLFLTVLAACGVAADACRAAGISRDTAYNLRNRAEGAAFAIAWNAALLIARGRMDDELMSRALNGVIERIYRNGELWGERHRHDNRLAMAVLTRLDRQAAGLGEAQWPAAARKVTENETNGTCPIRQAISSAEPGSEDWAPPPATGLARVRAEYVRRFPPKDPADGELAHVWEDEEFKR
jgi:hypothetical protein